MTTHSEIDETLRRLGSVEPPPGLKRRLNLRLQTPRSRFSSSMIQTLAACGVAASVALSAVALNPALRSVVFHHHSSAQSHAGGQCSAGGARNTGRVRDCFSSTCTSGAGARATHAG